MASPLPDRSGDHAMNTDRAVGLPATDDPTAELLSNCLDAAGLDVARTITWNAYPWYINKSPTASQLDAGIMPLRRLLELLPEVSVVMLMGRRAEDSCYFVTSSAPRPPEQWRSR